MDWLLSHNACSSVITEDVIVLVASLVHSRRHSRHYYSSLDSLVALIERCPNQEPLEAIFQHASINSTLVNVILDMYPDMKPTQSVLIALAASEMASEKSESRLTIILDKYQDVEISQDVLIGAAQKKSPF